MRIKVTAQNILEYGLDKITGNTTEDLMARALEMEKEGYDLTVTIPDVEGGDTEAPTERNIFQHYSGDLPEPEGISHDIQSFDLRTQSYIQNPCKYQLIHIGNGEQVWICKIHEMPSKHSIDVDSRAPCLTMDPYDT